MIQPLGNSIYIKRDDKSRTGTILLPDNAAPESVNFVVVSVGPDVKGITEGDTVIIRHGATYAPAEGGFIGPASDVLGLIK